MATNTLKTRIVLNNKTNSEWASDTYKAVVPLKGEVCIYSDLRKIKIGDGTTTIANLAFANLTPEEINSLISAANHTHSNKSILDATTASFTSELLTKLNGIATGATKVTVDSSLSSTSTNPVQNKVINSALEGKVPTTRTVNGKALSSNITLSASDVGADASGAATNAVSTHNSSSSAHSDIRTLISNLTTEVGNKAASSHTHDDRYYTESEMDTKLNAKLNSSLKGAANGLAELDSNGKVPSSQLPSYVDDVIEGYLNGGKLYKESAHTTNITGESGKIYIDLHTGKTYRWSGTAFVVISDTIALGETSSTAYRGDRGKVAYDHSQATHAPTNAERNVIVGIQKNGTDLTPDSSTRKVNITVPTKTSEMTNDSGFLTSSGTISKANQLTNARNFSITGGATAAAVSFNGTGNVALNVTALDAMKLSVSSSDSLILDGSI